MPLYEHVFIARQDLSNAQAERLIDHFGEVLTENGGSLDHREYWGLRTMAYRINKNRKGHYGYFRTNAPAAAVAEMERQMRFHEDILRILTTRVAEHESGPSIMMQPKPSRDHGRSGRT